MATILVIDDDAGIRKLIENALRKDGHVVLSKDRVAGLSAADFQDVDLLLLDVMMPETDGFSFCRRMRGEIDCPILFLTAKTSEEEVVEGLSLGADDYIKKPFRLSELRARVAAHLRREKRERQQKLVLGSVRFHLAEKVVSVEGTSLPLTKSEYEICELLARHRGQVFSLESIVTDVFGYDAQSDASAIREHVKNIRRKFSLHGECPIETVWGVGYKWI